LLFSIHGALFGRDRMRKCDMKYYFVRSIAIGLTLLLTGCISVHYQPDTPSYFSGRVLVIWVGETEGGAGDGTFLFVPSPVEPLVFHRNAADTHGRLIEPGLMYTDGGSIPKIAQVFNGLSPWGYAPAYMIHDWIFTARHCLVDGEDDPKYGQVRDIDFDESAEILNEAISALVNQRQVRRDDLAIGAITGAVDSFVARDLWQKPGACKALKVSAEHRAAVRQLFPGLTAGRKQRAPSSLALELQSAADAMRGKPLPPARLITEVTFDKAR
jgi:hypothetical protein